MTLYFRRHTAQIVAPSHRPRSRTTGNPRDGAGGGCSSQEGDLGALHPVGLYRGSSAALHWQYRRRGTNKPRSAAFACILRRLEATMAKKW